MEKRNLKIKSINDCTVLNNGVKMPWLGFGVNKITDGQDVEFAVKSALEVGYRSIDTASVYDNESGVGNAIRQSVIPREEIFLTTKLWTDDMRAKRTLAAFEESLERLGTDYVDLYLIHWPVKESYLETWKVMEEIYKSGRAKAIGVSNFLEHQIESILKNSSVVPAVNQFEFHPYLIQPELLEFCKAHQIQTQAASPLMRGKIFNEPDLLELAEKYKKTTAQIVLRWDIQHGVATIPKSFKVHRMTENAQIFNFELTTEDMNRIDSIDKGMRVGSHPDNFRY